MKKIIDEPVEVIEDVPMTRVVQVPTTVTRCLTGLTLWHMFTH